LKTAHLLLVVILLVLGVLYQSRDWLGQLSPEMTYNVKPLSTQHTKFAQFD